jgi:hypothetical protein
MSLHEATAAQAQLTRKSFQDVTNLDGQSRSRYYRFHFGTHSSAPGVQAPTAHCARRVWSDYLVGL